MLLEGGSFPNLLYYVLLEQDGTEARVHGSETLVLQDLGEATDETVGEGGLGDETDTGSLERAEGDVGEELSSGSRGEVHGSAVVGGSLVSELVDALLLEELVSTELEGALKEVSGEGRTETGQERAGTLIGNDLPEATDEALVVGNGIELYPGLDAMKSLALHMSLIAKASRNPDLSHWHWTGRVMARKTYTSTGVKPPWVTAQQTAPAKANLE